MVFCPQRGGGVIHNVGHAHHIQHGLVVVVVAKGHDLCGIDAKGAAHALHPDALVGKGGIDPERPRHGAVGLLPAGHKALYIVLHALVQVHRHLGDVLRHLGGAVDDLVVVAHELHPLQHPKAALHQVGGVLAGEHHLALSLAAGPHIVGDLLCQRPRHGIFGDAMFFFKDGAAVFADKHAAVCHRCKKLAQAGILPPGGRAEPDAPLMQRPDLVEDLALQFFFAVLQQRTVNIAANQSDVHGCCSFPFFLILPRFSATEKPRAQLLLSFPVPLSAWAGSAYWIHYKS